MIGEGLPQGGSGGVGDDLEPAAAEALRARAFHGDCHEGLACCSTAAAFAGLHPTDGGIVDLHIAREHVPARPHHGAAQPVEHRPGGLVGPESEDTLQPER